MNRIIPKGCLGDRTYKSATQRKLNIEEKAGNKK